MGSPSQTIKLINTCSGSSPPKSIALLRLPLNDPYFEIISSKSIFPIWSGSTFWASAIKSSQILANPFEGSRGSTPSCCDKNSTASIYAWAPSSVLIPAWLPGILNVFPLK